MGDRVIPASSCSCHRRFVVNFFASQTEYEDDHEDDGRSDDQEFPRLPVFQSVENEHENDWERESLGALEHTRSLNEGGDFGEADALLEITHHEWAIPPHFSGISFHDFQRCADVGSEVNLVNDQKIGFRDAWSSFAGDFFTTGNINDIDRQI